MTLAEFPQLQALSPRDKLQLVDELWIDVIHNVDSVEPSEQERSILDARWTSFITDPASAMTLEECKTRVRDLRG